MPTRIPAGDLGSIWRSRATAARMTVGLVAIAPQPFLDEKTVDRCVSNSFVKQGVPSGPPPLSGTRSTAWMGRTTHRPITFKLGGSPEVAGRPTL